MSEGKSSAGPTEGNRDLKATARPRGRVGWKPVLLCEVSEGCLRYEAREEDHRTERIVNRLQAELGWVSVLSNTTPDIRLCQGGIDGGGGGTSGSLTPGELHESRSESEG